MKRKKKSVEENINYLFEGRKITVRIIRSSRRSFALAAVSSNEICVKAPLKSSDRDIYALIEKHSSWLSKRLDAFEAAEKDAPVPMSPAELSDLAQRAKGVLKERLPYYASLVGVKYNGVTVRCQKTRWGSCSAKKNLNFNCLLILAPPEVFDYVMVHELCHLKQMNHSEKFWAEVAKIVPDYKKHVKWLKDNGPRLMKKAGK